MFATKLNCLLGRHKPVRRDVVWTDAGYVGACRGCGGGIRRTAPGKWHLEDHSEVG